MRYEITKELETGNEIIDNEHRKLFEIVNQLIEAMDNGQAMSVLRPVIKFLLDYVMEHFKHEEQLQEQGGYPGLKAHREFHENYKKELREILLKIQPTGPTISDIINLNGHISMLINHVKNEDRKMCRFLSQNHVF